MVRNGESHHKTMPKLLLVIGGDCQGADNEGFLFVGTVLITSIDLIGAEIASRRLN